MIIDLPRAWVVRINVEPAPVRAMPDQVHTEELVFSLALLVFVLWLTLRALP
jgi:hypothetical protein